MLCQLDQHCDIIKTTIGEWKSQQYSNWHYDWQQAVLYDSDDMQAFYFILFILWYFQKEPTCCVCLRG